MADPSRSTMTDPFFEIEQFPPAAANEPFLVEVLCPFVAEAGCEECGCITEVQVHAKLGALVRVVDAPRHCRKTGTNYSPAELDALSTRAIAEANEVIDRVAVRLLERQRAVKNAPDIWRDGPDVCLIRVDCPREWCTGGEVIVRYESIPGVYSISDPCWCEPAYTELERCEIIEAAKDALDNWEPNEAYFARRIA